MWQFWEMLEKLVKHVPLTTRSPPPDIILINGGPALWKMTVAGAAVNVLAINTASSPVSQPRPILHWHYIAASPRLNPSPSSPISNCSCLLVMCNFWMIPSLQAHLFYWVESTNSMRCWRNVQIMLWHLSTAGGRTSGTLSVCLHAL